MPNRIPLINKGIKICIICEGAEEYEYLEKLKQLDIWQKKYSVILKNADGISNISSMYQDKYQNDNYDLVLVFCDTEAYPYNDYKMLKEKINKVHGKSKQVIFFANPCTMQIFLQHFDNVNLQIANKSSNEQIIYKLTGIQEYRATDCQRRRLFNKINRENYVEMKKRIKAMNKGDKIIGSTNLITLLENLEKEGHKWIHDINNIINKD